MDELVNIPALLYSSDGKTQFQNLSVFMVCALIALKCDLGKSGSNSTKKLSKDKAFAESIQVEELPRKISRVNYIATVPQTDTGRRGEKPKVYERTFVKELGKTAVVISR